LPIYLNKLGDMLFTMTDDSSPRVHLRLLLVAKKNAQHLHKKKKSIFIICFTRKHLRNI